MSRHSSTSNWSRRARKRYRREDSYYQTETDKIKIALINDEFLNHIIFGQKHLKDRKKAADILFFGLSNKKYNFEANDVKNALEQLLNLKNYFQREDNSQNWYGDIFAENY